MEYRSPYRTQPVAQKVTRVCVRIPVRIAAKIFVKGDFKSKVVVNDLSSTGISFLVKDPNSFPDRFEIHFRLGLFSPPIKVNLEVKNRIPQSSGTRLGCMFDFASDKDKKAVAIFITGFCDYSSPLNIVGWAALLCALDATIRIVAYAAFLYYRVTEQGVPLGAALTGNLYPLALLFYALAAVAALVFSAIAPKRKMRAFSLAGIILLTTAFAFIIIKSVLYWRLGLIHTDVTLVKALCMCYGLFAVFVAHSLWVGADFLKRVKTIADIESIHRSHIAGE
jgi:hypothetical protein